MAFVANWRKTEKIVRGKEKKLARENDRKCQKYEIISSWDKMKNLYSVFTVKLNQTDTIAESQSFTTTLGDSIQSNINTHPVQEVTPTTKVELTSAFIVALINMIVQWDKTQKYRLVFQPHSSLVFVS